MFFYGSARYFENVRGDRINQLGQELPDRVRERATSCSARSRRTPTQQHLLTSSFRTRPNDVEAENQVSTDHGRSVAYHDDNRNRVATATLGVLPDRPQHGGCEVSLSEGEERGRAGDGPRDISRPST